MTDKSKASGPGKKPGSFLHIECAREDKSRWINAARGQKLQTWVINALNEAARKQGED